MPNPYYYASRCNPKKVLLSIVMPILLALVLIEIASYVSKSSDSTLSSLVATALTVCSLYCFFWWLSNFLSVKFFNYNFPTKSFKRVRRGGVKIVDD